MKVIAKDISIKQSSKTNSIYSKNRKNNVLQYYFQYLHIVIPILLFTALIYIRVFQNGLTNRDDDTYIINNPYLVSLSLHNIISMFSSFFMGNYHPFSMLCLAIGYQIGGTDAWIYQLINLSIHLFNTYLVFHFALSLLKISQESNKQNIIIATITALLFGIHPIHVESVAWVSENKNVLYTLFFLTSLINYLKYLRQNQIRHYIYSIVFFVFSLLSKGMAVSLTLTLIVIDLYFGRKIYSRKVILEKLPFLFLSLLFGIIAVFAQDTALNQTNINSSFKIVSVISFASYGLIQYVLKLLFPFNLSAYYEYLFLTNGPIPKFYYTYLVVLILFVIALSITIKRKSIYFFGVLFFLANIILVLQLIPVGDAIMADRYSYIPSIGFFLIISTIISKLIGHKPQFKIIIYALLIGYATMLSVTTFQRIAVWKDSITLWGDVLKKADYSKYSKAWLIRGTLYNQQGKHEQALIDIKMHFKAHGVTSIAYFQRAYAKSFLNDPWGSIEDYTLASEFDSTNPWIFNNRGNIKNSMRYSLDALVDYNKAIAISDTFVDAYNGRADAKIIMLDYEGALNDLNHSIALRPGNPLILNNRGVIKKKLGDYIGGLNDFNSAIRLNSNFMEAYQNRVDINILLNNFQDAIKDLNYILSFQQIPIAYYYRGYSNFHLGNKPEACKDFQQAISFGYNQIDKKYLKFCEDYD